MTTESDVLARYSTPGLKKCELDRQNKKDQLNGLGMAKFPADRDKILDQLYGAEDARPPR